MLESTFYSLSLRKLKLLTQLFIKHNLNPMKTKLLLMLIASMLASAAWAQQLPRQVIASGGNISQAGNVNLSWTVGQPGPVQSATPSSFYITQGFQQGDEWWVSINEVVVAYDAINLYPNPSYGEINLTGKLPAGGVCNYMVFDNNGKAVADNYFSVDPSGEFLTNIQLTGLATGTYYLRLVGGNDNAKYVCSKKISIIK